MENVLIILIAVAAAAFIVVSIIYNSLDRMRFYMDQMLKRIKPTLEEWAEDCGKAQPGSADAYRAARKNWEKTACLREMAEKVPSASERQRALRDELMELCTGYNSMAERYNERREGPILGKIAEKLRFRPYAVLDFYPDVQLPDR